MGRQSRRRGNAAWASVGSLALCGAGFLVRPALVRRAAAPWLRAGEGGASRRRGRSRRRAAERRALPKDWRSFRAELVRQEQNGWESSPGRGVNSQEVGWAHASPLLEQGSVLLASPGSHFALQNQCFHKAVILIFSHSDMGDMGMILNRPTAFTLGDTSSGQQDLQALMPAAGDGAHKWNVWFGGGSGLSSRSQDEEVPLYCVHELVGLAEESTAIAAGAFFMDFAAALRAVKAGRAHEVDFLLLAGFVSWAPGQLQEELDRDGSWTLAAADSRMLLGGLRAKQAALACCLAEGRAARLAAGSAMPLAAADVGDGIGEWRELYAALGSDHQERLAAFASSGDEAGADEVLRHWVGRYLVPRAARRRLASGGGGDLRKGVVLRASPTQWLLGTPDERKAFELWSAQPAQYLHKGVLLLLEDTAEGRASSTLLLNGPQIGVLEDGGDPIFFGGPDELNDGTLFRLMGWAGLGHVVLPAGSLQQLLCCGAVEVAHDVGVQEVLAAPRERRWLLAGGKVSSMWERSLESLGDEQQRRWYMRFLGVVATPEA